MIARTRGSTTGTTKYTLTKMTDAVDAGGGPDSGAALKDAQSVGYAERDPTARIALVAASLGEARRVMVEGDSGLLAIASPRARPRLEPSRRQLVWPGGARQLRTGLTSKQRLRIVVGDAGAATDRASVEQFWSLLREATSQRVAGEAAVALATPC